jgi:hypothetical protein
MLNISCCAFLKLLMCVNNFICIILQQLSEIGDDRDFDANNNLTARVPSWKDEVSSSRTSADSSSRSTMTESAQEHQFSVTPYTAPKLTPGSTPKFLSGPTSPTKSLSEVHSTFSSWHGSSSHQYSAPTSPPQHRSFAGRPRIDGKEFFRQARLVIMLFTLCEN